LVGAGATSGLVYALVLNGAQRIGVRIFWRGLTEGGDPSWGLRTQTFWILVAAILVGGAFGYWIGSGPGKKDEPKKSGEQ